jgi:hypothetical protein
MGGRITPKGEPQNYRTFQVTAPIATHTRIASCEEVECPQYARGWKMTIDLNTDLGQKQAHYIKNLAGRSYKKTSAVGGLVELEFAANQPCFGEHRVRLDRPEIYRVKGGDFRGNPLRTPTRVHKKAEFWVEEFQINQDRLKTAEERG